MTFNPNAMMKKQFERMISQRFGSVDNMMNDMSKFAGNNPTLKNALDLYKKGDTDQLHQIQQNCSPNNNLTAINGTAPTTDTPVTQAARKGAM